LASFKRLLYPGLPIVFAASVFLLIVWFAFSKPRVLILHSYDDTYSWTRDVNVGLERILGKKNNWDIRHYDMDTKRHPWMAYKFKMGIAARRMIDDWKPTVIIAIDDDAQQFVGRYYVNHPTIKLVFSGVNLPPSTYDYVGASNVTGVMEKIPLSDMRTAILDYARMAGREQALRVVFIDDSSDTVTGDAARARAFDWSPLVFQGTRQLENFDQYKSAILAAQTTADIIVVDAYRKISRSATDRTLVSPLEIQAWAGKNSKLPMIGVNAFVAEDGGMLAIGTSPFEQGERAAELAVRIIDGGMAPSQIPFESGDQFVVAMRARQISEKKFALPRVYEAAARSVNKFYP
jgi:hypothetical protein